MEWASLYDMLGDVWRILYLCNLAKGAAFLAEIDYNTTSAPGWWISRCSMYDAGYLGKLTFVPP